MFWHGGPRETEHAQQSRSIHSYVKSIMCDAPHYFSMGAALF